MTMFSWILGSNQKTTCNFESSWGAARSGTAIDTDAYTSSTQWIKTNVGGVATTPNPAKFHSWDSLWGFLAATLVCHVDHCVSVVLVMCRMALSFYYLSDLICHCCSAFLRLCMCIRWRGLWFCLRYFWVFWRSVGFCVQLVCRMNTCDFRVYTVPQ